MNAQETSQQKFKELLQDIYVIAQKAEQIEMHDLILEIKKKLSVVIENNH